MAEHAALPRHDPPALDVAELADLEAFLRELLLAAGPATLAHFRSGAAVDNKKAEVGGYDPVTAADRAAESLIREHIAARYPEHGIYGEEHGYAAGSAGLTWIIDPIDGTRAFITGQLHWGILVGLYDGRRAVLGGAHQPFTGELFLGGPGGAWLEHHGARTPLGARPCGVLSDAVLGCTTPDMFSGPGELAAFERLAKAVRLRRFGGDCYSYCMLAHGLMDLIVEADLAPYDVAGLIPVIEAAGGVVTDWEGGPAVHGGRVVAAGDPRVHAQALQALTGTA